ncbi:MAG: hypothetical protein AB1Z66_02655 [Candidatus Limnocylindrales bacterium]
MNTPTSTPSGERSTGWDPGDWPEPSGRVRGSLAALGIGTLIALGAVVLVGGSASGGPTEASVAQIVDEPADFEGDRVASDGEVEELLTDRTLVVQGEAPDEDLLLVIRSTAFVSGYPSAPTAPFAIADLVSDEDDVRFTGVVDEFDQEQMAAELGIVLHDGLFERWEGEPSIVVDRLELEPRTATAAGA